jgi:repressor LexA
MLNFIIEYQTKHAIAPSVREIAAEDPIEAIARTPQELAVTRDFFGKGNFFALTVRGDSLRDAHILDGDLAVIRVQSRVETGRIAAVIVRDLFSELTLKIIRRSGRTLVLEPANAAYEPLVFTGKERSRVEIIGKLAGVIRRS